MSHKNTFGTKPHLSSTFPPLLPSVISVTKPLDYEQVPNGMIYLTVMAKDGGNPALNSTVPVTVEVIVSTTLQNAHTSLHYTSFFPRYLCYLILMEIY